MPCVADVPLSGKSAFIAGASGGINLEIARALGRAGAKVALASRDPARISAAADLLQAEGLEAFPFAADVRDYEAVAKSLAATHDIVGPLDIVVSGAAGNFVAPALGMSANGFRTVVDIDLLGTFNVLRAAFEHLRRPGASLISITAPQAERPQLLQAHVCAAKAGVNMLTRCLAMEWGPAGVRVNAVSPGPIAGTEGMARLAPTADAEAAIKARLPLRDYGTTKDVAEAVLFLASEQARYITGHILNCDGGVSLGDASGDVAQTVPAVNPRTVVLTA